MEFYTKKTADWWSPICSIRGCQDLHKKEAEIALGVLHRKGGRNPKRRVPWVPTRLLLFDFVLLLLLFFVLLWLFCYCYCVCKLTK